MDTCIGEKSTQDLDAARELQRKLLEALDMHENAMYPNAVCVLAELQQDVVLDAAEEAGRMGGDVKKELSRLKALYESMLHAGGLSERSSGVVLHLQSACCFRNHTFQVSEKNQPEQFL